MKKLYFFFFLVCLFINPGVLHAQEISITGTVTDQQGDPIIGCSIIIKGTTQGTVTDFDGKFALTVSPGSMLVFSYIGMQSKEIRIEEGKTTYFITLEDDMEILTEHVVIGYGVVPRSQQSVLSLSNRSYDALSQEEYTTFGENKFLSPFTDPVSTFSADVDAAAYTNVRRFLKEGFLPPKDAIRTEELINYFTYDYKPPTDKEAISIQTEVGKCPWNPAHLLFSIGLKTKEILTKDIPPMNLVFLIDTSGSMYGPTRLDLVKSSLNLLINNLRDIDKVSIVVYAGNTGVALPATSGKQKDKIREVLSSLEAAGSTAGGAGIQLAYEMAKNNFITGGNNRVILCTDGDFNVGVSSVEELGKLIEEKRKTGVYLSVLGYGMGNYKDNRMQELAQKGNGNHAYIDDISEAKKVLVNEVSGTLYTVAKDVKLQLEFNPGKVNAYRLIGYETRLMKPEDFNNDTKDAGDMGAGHTVTALYEIIPTESISEFSLHTGNEDKTIIESDELLTVKLRYKYPDEEESRLITVPVAIHDTENTSMDFRFASSVAMFGQLLRNSEFTKNTSFKEVLALAGKAIGKDPYGYRKEFLKLVKKADELTFGEKPLYGNIQLDPSLFEEFEEEVNRVEKYGFKDIGGNIAIPALYDNIEYATANLAFVEKNGKYGLYQYYSQEITPLIYDRIEILNEYSFRVEEGGFTGLIDYYGREILPAMYDHIQKEGYEFYLVEKDRKKGIYDKAGKKIVPVEYEDITHTNFCFIVEKNKLYGVYDLNGKNTVPVSYESIRDKHDVLVLYKKEKYGLANSDGKIILSPVYESEAKRIGKDLFIFRKNNSYGLVHTSGKTIASAKYKDIDDLKEEICVVENKKEKYGAYNTKGKKILQEKYDDIDFLYDGEYLINTDNSKGCLMVEINNKYGLFTTNGKKLLDIVFDDIEVLNMQDLDHSSDFMFLLEKNDLYGLADKNGKIILPPVYDDIDIIDETTESFSSDYPAGCVLVELKDKYGVWSSEGKMVLDVKYDDIEVLKSDDENIYPDYVFLTEENELYGLADKSGNMLLPAKYDDIEFIYDGRNLINTDGSLGCLEIERKYRSGIITPKGTVLLEVIYDNIEVIPLNEEDYISSFFFLIEKNNKYGLADKNGNILLPVRYDDIEVDYSSGKIVVEADDKKYYFDEQIHLTL